MQIGRFTVSMAVITGSPHLLMGMFGECIVLRAEPTLDCLSINYRAISAQFDDVPERTLPPRYEWTGHAMASGNYEFTAKRLPPDSVQPI